MPTARATESVATTRTTDPADQTTPTASATATEPAPTATPIGTPEADRRDAEISDPVEALRQLGEGTIAEPVTNLLAAGLETDAGTGLTIGVIAFLGSMLPIVGLYLLLKIIGLFKSLAGKIAEILP